LRLAGVPPLYHKRFGGVETLTPPETRHLSESHLKNPERHRVIHPDDLAEHRPKLVQWGATPPWADG